MMSQQHPTSNNESQSKTRRPPSRAKQSRSEVDNLLSSSDEDSSAGATAKRSCSTMRPENLNRSKEESQETSKKSPKVQLGRSSQSVPKQIKTLNMLPNTWCRSKVSTVSHTFKWTIENFSLLTLKKLGEALWSSQFKMLNLDHHLLIYPNGHGSNCKNNVCVFLEFSKHNIQKIDYELTLCNSKGKKITNTFNIRAYFCNKNSGVCRIVKSKDLLSFLDEDDTFVILCSLTINDNVIYEEGINNANVYHNLIHKNELEVLNNLNELKQKKEFCDLILCIEKEEFVVHKSILAVRSSYFAKLFEIYKGKLLKLSIDGVKSCTFKIILHFLYTGKILNIKTSIIELFKAACIFELPLLKSMCEMCFKRNVSLNNVLDILILADKLNALDLKQYTINYIAAHITDIVKAPGYTFAKKLSPDLMVQVFQKCFV